MSTTPWQKLLVVIMGLLPLLPGIGARVDVYGGGASFPSSLYEQWIQSFLKEHGSDVQISYISSSSSVGLAQLQAGSLAFSGSDIPPVTNDTSVTYFPAVAGAIALAYQIPQLSEPLNLSRQNIADIFSGKLTTWSDPALQVLNPTLANALPSATTPKITLVVRQPGSGTTANFVKALHSFDPSFPGPISSSVNWHNITNGTQVFVANTNEAVGMLVASIPYAISYMDLNEIYKANKTGANSIGVANIINRNGTIVTATWQSMQAAMSSNVNSSSTSDTIDTPYPQAYPITVYTNYVLRNNAIGSDILTARWTLRYLYWTLTRGSDIAIQNNFAPLTPEMVKRGTDILEFLTQNDQIMFGQTYCDFPIGSSAGCKHGHCFLDLPFQDPAAQCICDPGFINYQKGDCSEAADGYRLAKNDAFGIICISLMAVGLLIVCAVWCLTFLARHRPQIRAIAPNCCWVLLMGCLLGNIGILPYAGMPTDASCKIRLFFPPVAFGAAFGMMMMKLWRIYLIFGYQRKTRISIARNSVLIGSTLGIVVAELILTGLLVALAPPSVVVSIENATTGAIYQECGVAPEKKGLYTGLLVLLYCFNALLLFLCLFLAYATRKAYNRFGESKTIGFSIYIVTILMIFAVPAAYILPMQTDTERGTQRLLTCLIMFIISTGISLILFLPRLREVWKVRANSDSQGSRTSGAQVGGHRFRSVRRKSNPEHVSSFHVHAVHPTVCEVGLRQDRFGAQWQSATLCALCELDLLLFLESVRSSKVLVSFKLSEIIVDVLTTESAAASGSFSTSSNSATRLSLKMKADQTASHIVEFPSKEKMRPFLALVAQTLKPRYSKATASMVESSAT
ncbi:phosphate ABC transporter, phosphate-binding protein PstS [Spizellomyces punctatus DAOM BR117]|uniref:Phosphate ABC transporter, phosphate-binding protein PstS n=1 Tax=Spizellomyces punctatus (strain DAOM BR117) TaxID=645134 RepID=A0A0L0HAY0_SPIPD|nr:phosphate ABC transporter, phosphate-binding protein PstS [Spizellomyces punctatus DAOM BR117]KNC98076.1 phosphate ABC transporter, phosphate-binding protein PstS [Spizellomyces punctatus DAOM BR117]|eukprot:XP_016606116.1 phosphate ABC transporter, phosphate-binding protein PstS [Spizellomyces punctatus DAOM BR117]